MPKITKKYTVKAPDGQQYPATKWSVACQVAADIAKRLGNAEINVILSKDDVECHNAN